MNKAGELYEAVKEKAPSGNNGSYDVEGDFDGQIPAEIRRLQEAQDADRALAKENNWVREDGSIWWPEFSKDFDKVPGSKKPSNMKEGEVISRFVDNGRYVDGNGNYDPALDTGRYTAPEYVPESGRAMAGSDGKTEYLFKVKQTNQNDKQSNAAPYFDQEGLRIQYEHEKSMREMTNSNMLEYMGPRTSDTD